MKPPTPEQMLKAADELELIAAQIRDAVAGACPARYSKGAADLESIAAGIRDAVAGRMTPIEEIDPSLSGSGNVIYKKESCLRCYCSQTLPIRLQACRCECHPADRSAEKAAPL